MHSANEMKLLGSRISSCRQNKNMTQEELAHRLGITPQALSKWERGVSLPDVSMLADLVRLLEVSADYLLETEAQGRGAGNGSRIQQLQQEVKNYILGSLDSVELQFGAKAVPLFTDNKFVDKVLVLRRELARDGILLPIVRIKDNIQMDEQEFMITAYHNVLYSEKLDVLDENTVDYMIKKLGECVRQKYHEILDPDIIKSYVDNLRIKYPALIEGAVPERISYTLLAEVARLVVAQGDSIIYLPKMIEVIDCALRENPGLSAQELAVRIRQVIEREDNIDVVLGKRREQQAL